MEKAVEAAGQERAGMSLTQRSVRSSAYNVISQALQLVVLFVRSVVLARLLSPALFGVYAFAHAIVDATEPLPTFGLGSAFVHRAPESEHRDAPAVYLTLIALFTLAWGVSLAIMGALFLEGPRRVALWTLVAVTFLAHLAFPAQAILERRVLLQRLAWLNLLRVALSTLAAIALARQGAGLWSLLAIDIVGVAVLILGLYAVRPVWRPRLAWPRPVVRYFLRFGAPALLANLLEHAVNQIDDLWTGRFLDDLALGFYSRAYAFANYPGRVLAGPINAVVIGTYAEVKDDRRRLSQAFFRANAFMIRTGFLFAGVLWLIAPEFVRLLLGAKWLPMLEAFRLMVAYVMLDPLKHTTGHLYIAVGEPQFLARTRAVQLAVLLAGLFLLGPRYGIAGVALAATTMLLVGIGLLFWRAGRWVDFSLPRLFAVPLAATLAGAGAAWALTSWVELGSSPWLSAAAKALPFILVYAVILLLAEREEVAEMVGLVRQALRKRGSSR